MSAEINHDEYLRKKERDRKNYRIVEVSWLSSLMERSGNYYTLELLKKIDEDCIIEAVKALEHSKSQIQQDIFALSELNFKKNGYFVEFGGTNGVNLNNTHILENHFGWDGILAEPARVWHEDLFKNRKCSISTKCVWKESNRTLSFLEANEAELSTIQSYSDHDRHAQNRKDNVSYEVETISLLDLLQSHDAPSEIDYLSIDTEGSEFEILNSFDFSKYSFRVITCEHNHTEYREKIYDLLTKHGYERKYKYISRFDDWYIKP